MIFALLLAGVACDKSKPKTNANTPKNVTLPQSPGNPNAPPGAQPPNLLGSPTATVTVEEFADFQCPQCANVHNIMKNITSAYGSRIKFVFRHFPLTQIHKNALDAAHAAVAAGLQDKFWEMHNLLYENQKNWEDADDLHPIAAGYAGQLGLNVQQFVLDMDGAKVAAAVVADVRRGDSMGVNGTPTVFIDGQLIDFENLTTEILRKEIDKRLSVRR